MLKAVNRLLELDWSSLMEQTYATESFLATEMACITSSHSFCSDPISDDNSFMAVEL